MPRYKLIVEYDGTPFVGWQVQENGPSVQGRLALAVEAFSGEEIVPRGARPDPISVLACEIVPESFDARFSATARHYLYRIIDRRSPLALERDRAWGTFRRLDVEAMQEASQVLIGNHDFTTFRSSECQAASPVKTLDRLDVSRHGEVIRVETSARSFLHNQVRSMVGSLKLVGEGRWTKADLAAALQARDRKACGPLAPPHGLYLIKVDY
jgi:tRNA pseudouridine38-40 synthase